MSKKEHTEFLQIIVNHFTPEDRLLAQMFCSPWTYTWMTGKIFDWTNPEEKMVTVEEFNAKPWVIRTITNFACWLDEKSVDIANLRYAEKKLKRKRVADGS